MKVADRLTYVRVGGPPDDWHRVGVIHVPSGEVLQGIVEADAEEGWVMRAVFDRSDRLVTDAQRNVVHEKVECEIRLERF